MNPPQPLSAATRTHSSPKPMGVKKFKIAKVGRSPSRDAIEKRTRRRAERPRAFQKLSGALLAMINGLATECFVEEEKVMDGGGSKWLVEDR
ncbi:hypothetical protein L596_011084 [Steinernema carpocapsae]|uniref:Uncharacterized protein n=1 Tax=Steinernema carpocapsae TaxID=34508 RepID=A0A4U5NTJ6_STECR|nr:hypothetical protein L596_011084 [Steinernema carpocapsae]